MRVSRSFIEAMRNRRDQASKMPAQPVRQQVSDSKTSTVLNRPKFLGGK